VKFGTGLLESKEHLLPKRTQPELNAIWAKINQGQFDPDPMVIAPRRIPAEDGTDIMSIPNATGTSRDVYQRKVNTPWEEIQYVGEGEWSKVKAALENPDFKWRTVVGVVKETGLDVVTVSANLAQNVDTVVSSTIPDPLGSALFTTRRHYREKSSLLDRLKSAIINKVQE
jgi:hypothetical protein